MESPFENSMTLIIAGKDCSGDLGTRIQKRVESRQGPTLLAETHPESSATSLCGLNSEDEFLERYLELMRTRYAISLHPVPASGPKILQAVKKVFRKLAGGREAELAAEQSRINEVMIMGFRFQREQSDRRIADLEERLRKLEGDS